MVGTLVTIAILLILAIAFTVGSGALTGKKDAGRPDGKGETLIGRSMYRAKDEVCRSNLGQVRQAVQIATDPVEGTAPDKIEDTRLGADFYKCPVGGEPYVYENATVRCPHAGHEKY